MFPAHTFETEIAGQTKRTRSRARSDAVASLPVRPRRRRRERRRRDRLGRMPRVAAAPVHNPRRVGVSGDDRPLMHGTEIWDESARDADTTDRRARLHRVRGMAQRRRPCARANTGRKSGERRVSYVIRVGRRAKKELERIPKPDLRRVVEAIHRLGENPHAGSVLKGNQQGLRRIRVGSWRVLYEVDDDASIVSILRAAHRRDAYRWRAR